MNFKSLISFEQFLKDYGLYLSLGVAALILIVLLIFLILSKRAPKKVQKVRKVDQSALFLALGGIDNIKELAKNGSRLSVVLDDYSLLDEEAIKKLGGQKLIKMTNKIIILVDDSFSDIEK